MQTPVSSVEQTTPSDRTTLRRLGLVVLALVGVTLGLAVIATVIGGLTG